MTLQQHYVTGGSDTRIYVESSGDPAQPAIIYVHGFGQSRLVWNRQFYSDLAAQFYQVRIDLRGHGNSAKPVAESAYQEGQNWADDIQAVINELGLHKPVVVGSSYGGLIMTDYLRIYGQDRLGGIVYVGAGSETGTREAGAMLGAEFMQLGAPMLAGTMAESIPAIQRYIELSTLEPMSAEDLYMFIGFNAIVPQYVRQGMLLRQFSSDEVLRKVQVPVLIIHGADDQVVLPAFADFIAERIPHAQKAIYPSCGHLPFFEHPERFNADIAAFVRTVHGGTS